MQIDKALAEQAAQLLKATQSAGVAIVTAESCTAGLLSNVLSTAPGASKQLHGGFVTYTKEAKTRVLGVSADMLRRKTAVHEDVAIAMAEGALARAPGDIAISVTGVAGPEPDEDGNPVGLVFCATVRNGAAPRWVKLELGDIGRDEILRRILQEAMALAQKCLEEARQPAAASP
jgi:nicotinamide-nucleotide amidase